MKQFTRFFTLSIVMVFAISFMQAQSTVMTKAQVLGIESNGEVQTPVWIGSSSARDVLLEEGFDAETFPPDGWQVINTHPENNWFLGNPQNNPFSDIDPESVYSALCPWIAEDQDEWLITPEITPSGMMPLNLNFYLGISGPWLTGATVKVNISTDGGATWTELWDVIDYVDPEADWAWTMYTLNLDDYAGAPFHIAWQYIGNDGDLAALDGVSVKEGYD